MTLIPPSCSPARILWLTASAVTAAPLAAAGELAAAGAWSVVVVAWGDGRSRKQVAPGVALQMLAAQHPGQGPLSWDVAEFVASADLVHLLDPCSLSAALGLLAAKLRGIPVVANTADVPAGLWGALDLQRLAAWIVPRGTSVAELDSIYRIVLAAGQEAA
jgi:hypothetical protein